MDLVYFQRKLQQDRYGWCFFKLKEEKAQEETYFE